MGLETSSMPSGRSAARIGTAGLGDPRAPDRAPPSNASGLGNNRLMASGGVPAGNNLMNASALSPVPLAGGNMLTGPLPLAPAQAVPPPPPPIAAPPPGQERHAAVGKMVSADKLSDAGLARVTDRFLYMHSALGDLAAKPDLSRGDVADVLAKAVREGEVPAAEAKQILGQVTADPGKLRQEVSDKRHFATAALVHLVGEQQRRAKAK